MLITRASDSPKTINLFFMRSTSIYHRLNRLIIGFQTHPKPLPHIAHGFISINRIICVLFFICFSQCSVCVCVCFFPRLGLSMFEFVINGMHSGRFHSTCERNCSRDIFVAFSIQIAFLFAVKFRQVSSVFILVLCFHEISVGFLSQRIASFLSFSRC